MIEKLPEIQIHSSAKINEKLNEVIDWINDVSALRVTDKQVTANLPNIDAGELAFLSKENTELKDELERTRKALDVAVDALKHYCTDSDNWSCVIDFTGDYNNTPSEFADKALEQITALEQKDVK